MRTALVVLSLTLVACTSNADAPVPANENGTDAGPSVDGSDNPPDAGNDAGESADATPDAHDAASDDPYVFHGLGASCYSNAGSGSCSLSSPGSYPYCFASHTDPARTNGHDLFGRCTFDCGTTTVDPVKGQACTSIGGTCVQWDSNGTFVCASAD